jgi:hypothetical protein
MGYYGVMIAVMQITSVDGINKHILEHATPAQKKYKIAVIVNK